MNTTPHPTDPAQRHPVAFLIHPRTDVSRDLGGICPPLGLIPNSAYEAFFRRVNLPSLVTGHFRYQDAPQTPAGWLILVPLSPRELLAGGRRVQGVLNKAVDKAARLGAKTVGLGALTAPASAGGALFRQRQDIGVTNGNALTAAMTYLGALRLLTRCPRDARIALVGATGSVGSCLTQLLARHTDHELLLVARHEGRLQGLHDKLGPARARTRISTDMSDLRSADLVILLTSATDALLHSEHLKEGAVVLDDTQPRNTDPRLLEQRPDVLVVDGGLVSIPGLRNSGFIGLPKGITYACLAETLLLGLAGQTGHFALGLPSVEQAEHMLELAQRFQHLGFQLAPLHAFGRPIEVERPRLQPRMATI